LESPEDFERLELGKAYSMHDFDLGYNLRLLKSVGRIYSAEIVCVGIGIEDAFNQIQLILRKWVAQDMQGS